VSSCVAGGDGGEVVSLAPLKGFPPTDVAGAPHTLPLAHDTTQYSSSAGFGGCVREMTVPTATLSFCPAGSDLKLPNER
jgi:hypothetical protein